jgi:acetyltransferase-like isoleucine patch superfamily enzyme
MAMKISTGLRRFFVPHSAITLYYFFRHRAFVSMRAEVDVGVNLTIGRKSSVSSFAKIKASEGPVRIGERTDIGVGCFIGGYKPGIEIGNDCLISPNVSIIGVNYRYDRVDQTFREQGVESKGPIRIGNNVWIGVGAVILDNAEIGDGVIVAPNSVVSGKIAPNSIVQGNPAKAVFVRR